MRKLVLAVSALLLLTACAEAPDAGTPSALPTTPSQSAAPASAEYIVSTDLGMKPTIEFPADAGNVDSLIITDIVNGSGPAVQPNDNVTVQYVGVGALSKQQFDASWDAGSTASFPLNGVILGWQQGLVGMKVGGRRLLVIPGDLAYGPNPPGGSGIQPNETLVFVVDLISIP